jgi:uncharacterized membrane protein
MQATIDTTTEQEGRSNRYLLPIMVGGMLLVFFAAPWPLQHKAHAALHGLCAQTPSHTFHLGDRPLPFDARMTGIYGGFFASFLYLVARRRHRAAKLPGWIAMGVLAAFVGVMAIDGFNSLLLDLGRPHPYQPDNRLRLLTGMGTGIALAVILCYLCAATLWRKPRTKQRVVELRELVVVVALQMPFGLAVLSGWGIFSIIVTMLLIVSAVTVVSTLALVAIVLLRRIDFTFDGFSDIQTVASMAVVSGIAVMALLSGGRFLLEHLLGLPPLT